MDNTTAAQPTSLLTELTDKLSYSLSSTDLQLGLVVVFAILVGGIVVASRKKNASLRKELARLRKDLQVANSTTIGMGQKLMNIEKHLHAHNSDQYKQHPSEQHNSVGSNPNAATTHYPSGQVRQPASSSHKPATLSLVNNHTQHEAVTPTDAAYQKSRELLSQGADIHDVVQQSGLSFSEVALMQKLAK